MFSQIGVLSSCMVLCHACFIDSQYYMSSLVDQILDNFVAGHVL